MPSPAEVFVKYKNGVLVETGSFTGGGIKEALKAGFPKVISLELQQSYFDLCKRMYEGDQRVTIVKGDSALILGKAIAEIKEPITFWLDGHYSALDTGFGVKGAPILEELEHIKQHPLSKHHTILIDDRRMLKKTGNGGKDTYFELTEDEVRAKLLEINPDYIFSYEHGYVNDDIIVARPPPHMLKTEHAQLADAKTAANTAAAVEQFAYAPNRSIGLWNAAARLTHTSSLPPKILTQNMPQKPSTSAAATATSSIQRRQILKK